MSPTIGTTPPQLHPEDRAASVALHGSALSRFRRGLVLGLPIFLGYLPVGVAFGILASTLKFSVAEAVICSATAWRGQDSSSRCSSCGTREPPACSR